MADDDGEDRQRQEQVVVQRRRREAVAEQFRRLAGSRRRADRVDLADAARTVGDVDRMPRLFMNTRMISPKPSVTMAVVAAQLQRRRAQQHAADRPRPPRTSATTAQIGKCIPSG